MGNGSPPAGSRGGAPVGVWGRSPQKLKYNVKFSAFKNRLRTRFCHVLLFIVSAILSLWYYRCGLLL